MKQTCILGLIMTITAIATQSAKAQTTPTSQMENLGKGVVALPAASGSSNFVSWRLLGTEDEDMTRYDLLRNGTRIAQNLDKTNYTDASGSKTAKYQIVTKVNGEPVDTSAAVSPWAQVYNPIKLNRPEGGITKPYTTTIDKNEVSFPNGQEYTYSPNDMSVGDVDGDGEYELFVKWDPSNSKDNSQNGVTGIVYIDCYKLDGTFLWRINLGNNIRAGAHYTQFLVYDFDGDGRAELMCKTAPGSKDGQGNYVNQAATDEKIKAANNTKDWVSEGAGRINGGQEYLTVFNGLTGAAVHTIAYNPNRNAKSELSEAAGSFNWGVGKNDTGSYGNRGERYLATVAYLDGTVKPASAVFCRGYYTYAFLWAVSFDGQQLRQRWLHKSDNTNGSTYTLVTYDAEGNASSKTFTGCKPTSGSGSGTMYGNGNHNISVADVDGDGCDEIIWGSAACNNDGNLLYGTGFGHGDAIHLGDHCPDRPGLEVFQVHEEKGTYAWDLHDAATGEILLKGGPEGVDNGRGIAGQFDANVRGSLFWSSSDGSARSAVTGNAISSNHGSSNFRIYWDGDLQEELLDGTKIDKWNGNGTSRVYINSKNPYDYNSSSSCNGTKSTPNLQADLFGDWREEIILWSAADNATLNIFSTNTPTDYSVPTLMHDHTYRMGVAWQNTAYNQPPHLGFYLPDSFLPHLIHQKGSAGKEQTVTLGDSITPIICKWKKCKSTPILTSIAPNGTRKALSMDLPGFTNTRDADTKTFTLKGKPEQEGDYQFILKLTSYNSTAYEDTLIVHVTATPNGIQQVATNKNDSFYYNLQGQRIEKPHHGIYIVNGRKRIVK